MASVDPTPIPTLPPLPEPVEPPVIAEAGVSTSEWKLLTRYFAQLAATATAAAVAKAGFSLPDSVIQYASQAEVLGAVLVVTYIISRSIRKKGTTA